MIGALVAANTLAWIVAAVIGRPYPHYLALAWLAYGFGLRHAVDADHICAIDNTTRKLMQDGKRPVGVGLFFSLGHSTVVVMLCALAAIAGSYAQAHIPFWKDLGGRVGTGVSTAFLYAIAAINLAVLLSLVKSASERRFVETETATTDELLQGQGLLGRIFRPILKTISSSWQMYFVGFLFGLGFDTATEVGMLSLSAQQAGAGLSFAALMLLPALFALGMSLIDSLNGVMMLGAYGWAFVDRRRKLFYNFSIVLVSVLVAFGVATKQFVEMMGGEMEFKGKIGNLINANLGAAIIGVFMLGWLISIVTYRLRAASAPLEPSS